MADVLRVGVAGLGEAATEFLPAYSTSPLIKLVACADLRATARARFEQEFGARSYASIEALCQADDVDVVVVATNHELHREHVLLAAANRKHVIVEKPMALTLEDCDAMIAACERHGVLLLGGHNHSYDAPIRKMRAIVASGELGPVRMIHSWNYNDFMTRPYPASHLEFSRGVVLNQGAHHVDVVRLLGGGLVRSVRAMTGRWDDTRPGDGAYTCYLEFEDGTPATLVYNGYGFFDTSDFCYWLNEGGQPRYRGANAASRQAYRRVDPAERDRVMEEMKERMRFGSLGVGERAVMPAGWEKGGRPPNVDQLETHQPFFGVTIVTCEKGDLRQSPDGIMIYGDEEREVLIGDLPVARAAEIQELYDGVVHGKPLLHDGRWCKATIEVCVAMLQSAAERRELRLSAQVPTRD